MSSCTVLAYVRNSKGEIVESRLFNDLLHYTSGNRALSKEYYAVGTNEEFLSKVRDSEKFETDENGEITFKSLRTLSKMDLETDKMVQILNKDFGEGNYPYDEALRRVRGFNEKSDWSDKMLATMVASKDGMYYAFIVPKTREVPKAEGGKEVVENTADEQKKLYDTVRNKELERKLITLLKSHGVSVKFIENAEKEGGRYSTENATQLENGLYGLVEVNETGRVSETLAEETGHFVIGALGDNPLVTRLEKLLEDPEVQKDAIGEYDFDNASLGSNPPREIAGRLVGKALARKLKSDAPFNVLANRIATFAKKVFYNIMGNEVRLAALSAEQIANRIAYKFVDGSSAYTLSNALNYAETMKHHNLTTNQKVYRDVIDELGRLTRKLDAIADDALAGKAKAALALTAFAGTDLNTDKSALQMEEGVDLAVNSLAMSGIVQALVRLEDYLGPGKEIDTLIKSVNFRNPSEFYQNMAKNGRSLRQARVFLRSAASIVKILKECIQPNYIGGPLINAGGTSFHDVKYLDEKGAPQSIDFEKVLNRCGRMIAATEAELTVDESAYFARFCEDLYGSKYITTATGILWKDIFSNKAPEGETDTKIEDLIVGEEMDDIDIFHRYLGSMANNPDVIGQIVDKLVRTSNKTADDATAMYRDQLLILEGRAKKLGLNMGDLLEKDKDGKPTGNMVTPPAAPNGEDPEESAICAAYMKELDTDDPSEVYAVHYGRWEEARAKHKEEYWGKFKEKYPDYANMPGIVRGMKWNDFYKQEYVKWNKANSIKVEVKDPTTGRHLYVKWVPNKLYQDNRWDELRAKYPPVGTGAERDTLDKWMHDYRAIKRKLDGLLPIAATQSQRLPQFKGTFMNSLRQSKALEKGSAKGFNAWRKTFGRRVVLENFVETAEDEDFGDMQAVSSGEQELMGGSLAYERERAVRLPIFGINKLKNLQDLDSDIIGSTIAYAAMATSYHSMSNIVDSLEVGRNSLYNRKIEGKDTWVEKGLRAAGNKWREFRGTHEVFEGGSKNRAYGRFLKYLEKQVYGISATHYSFPIWKTKRLVLNKLIQNITSLGGSLFLKGNVLGGTVNTLTGFFNIFKEAVVSDYFNTDDWRAAHRYYWEHIPEMWALDAGELKKDNKLNLFLEEVDAQNNNRSKYRNWHTQRSRFNNLYRNFWYLPYSAGDHYMQAMSYLAVAHGTKLYNTDGTLSSNLWEAFKLEENTDEFRKNPTGKSLKFQRFCPVDAKEINYQILDAQNVYLKPVERSTPDFENWLATIDPKFVTDLAYKKSHTDEYIAYRKQYDSFSDEEMMQYRAHQYQMLRSILEKVDRYMGAASPLVSVPSFTPEEQDYLTRMGLTTDHFSDIQQVARDGIYSLIWTKSDEVSYMHKCREINNRLHGIYNEQDKTAWHQQWYTNAFLAMKGWVLGYLEMMYSPNHYSIALKRNVEGFVNTEAKLVAKALYEFAGNRNWKGGFDLLLNMAAPWSKRASKAMKEAGFSEEQGMNAKRFTMAIALVLGLQLIKMMTALPSGGDDDDDEEVEDSNAAATIHYFATRTLLEQIALLEGHEFFIQSGQIMDAMPVGGAAVHDLWLLADEIYGAATTEEGDEDYSKYYHPKDDKNDRYEAGDPKYWDHLERITPYVKNMWALDGHMREAEKNYMFGRKLKTR